MNFNRIFLIALVFVLLSGQVSNSLNLISVQAIENSEDISEERIEQFASPHRQKFLTKKLVKVQPQLATNTVNLVQEFPIALAVPPLRIHLRNRVFLI